MKKVLILASVASMIDQFNMPNIELLQNMGYSVDVACNFKEGNTCSDEKITELKAKLKAMNVQCFQIDFARKVTNISRNIKAFWQVKKILSESHYEFLHCHSPIGGVVGRVAGKLTKTKVIYTAHGFHFYKGAPLKNWMIYYPVEKMCSYLTDTLITINKEDYTLAKKRMHARNVCYVPGVGINVEKFKHSTESKEEVRRKLGIPKETFWILSVGELNENKNHQIILKAMGTLKELKIQYSIAGIGQEKETLEELASKLGIAENFHLLGFRNDVNELYHAADVFCFPSKREGLGLAAIEAMASGLPLITSNVHGINDYSIDGITGYSTSPENINGFAVALENLYKNPEMRNQMGENNAIAASKYDIHIIMKSMRQIYGTVVAT